MRDLQADLERTKNQTDFIVTVSVPTITEWLERAIEAEAEVEQYHELFTEQTKVIRDIKTENTKMRAVVDAARGAIRYIDADVEDECCCVGCQTCRQLRAALAELDKEGER